MVNLKKSSFKERQIFAWCMYDWANSAFMTTAASALMPLYFLSLVPPGGWQFRFLGQQFTMNALTLWGVTATLGSFFIFLFAPFLGAIADTTTSKKKFMMFFCYLGCFSALALAFVPGLGLREVLCLSLLTGIGLSASFVFYDAFLPQIADRGEIDWISAKGYSFGYIGGGLQFLLSLILIGFHEQLGLARVSALRYAIAFSGLWWGGFALVTFRYLEESRNQQDQVEARNWKFLASFKAGFRQLFTTLKQIRSYRTIVLFLMAFMFYNEGIQTVVKMAVIYGKDELGFSDRTLMGALLLAQFVGAIGTLLAGKIARRLGTQRTLIGLLTLWVGISVFTYTIQVERDFWVLGGLVGLVLGGSQALSRSLYSSLLPPESAAEFFGFYSVFAKFSSILGPLLFGLIRQVTGSARWGVLLLVGFFLIGMVLLAFVRVNTNQPQRPLRHRD